MSSAVFRRRLIRLEQAVRAKQATAILDASDEDMLREFEELGRQGYFREEPDFPVALENYRQALATSPKSCPASASSPEANQAFFWMYELLDRVRRAIPPVTAAEFGELQAWFTAHDARLSQLSMPSQMLDLGDGHRIAPGNVRYDLRKGPRAIGAGEVAQIVRRLKVLFG